MSRSKKSRKMGQLGPRKTDTPKPVRIPKSLSEKNRKGLKAGGRNNDQDASVVQSAEATTQSKDKRVGSKKPIDLLATKPVAAKPQPKQAAPDAKPKAKQVKVQDDSAQIASWQAELANIEQDDKLMDLLERYENDESLTAQELAYMNKQTAKHADLLAKLGIDDDLDDEDLLDEWEGSDLKGDWS